MVLLTLLLSPLFGTVSHALGIGAAELPRTVVATGLLNPRGLAFGPDGSLYVAEAGAGGHEHVKVTKGDSQYHVGKTGRVSRLSPDGTLTVVANGLPSALPPTTTSRAHRHRRPGRPVYVLTAAGGTPWGDPSYDNAVFEIGTDGSATPVFDYQGYNIREPSLSRRCPIRAPTCPAGCRSA